MRVFTTFLTLLALAAQSFAYQSSTTATKKKATSKKSTRSKSTTAKGTPKSTTSKTSTSKTSRSKTKKPITPGYRRSSQQQPTVERYKEIQQALASKGYFSGPIDGAWGTASVDALKRFQRDQNLVEDGKIGSLSLLALGLGPKRIARAESQKLPPPPQP